MRFLLFLAFVAIVTAQQCDISATRTDCGYLGITQSECSSKGCCWSPADNLPYCFYQNVKPTCDAAQLRRDCGYVGIDQAGCENRGCCWSPSGNPAIPYCFYSNGAIGGYQVSSATTSPNGLTLMLSLLDGKAFYGPDIPSARVDVTYETVDRVRVKITDANNARYEIPENVLPYPTFTPVTADQANYVFDYTAKPFGFSVTRKLDGAVLFNSTTNGNFNGLVFEDQYLEMSTVLPTAPYVYGIGEHVRNLKLDTDNSPNTLWARDVPTPVNQNEYGSHPFYLEMRSGKAHGVFLRNSNGMDVTLNPGRLTYHIIGGIFDFYFFMGPEPETVVKQYQEVIGTPYMPPLWGLGWHQCRYGYHDIGEVEDVVTKYAENQIPLEVMWTDIDYMDGYKDFTWDPVRFPVSTVNSFIEKLHANGQKYVVIVDPAISNTAGYAPYDSGVKADIFIKDRNNNIFIGKVWPGLTAFPAFINEASHAWWEDQIRTFLNLTAVSGLWIDMNEPSNFCDGACTNGLEEEEQALLNPVTTNNLGFDPNNPPYVISNCGSGCSLKTKTLDMDAQHGNGLIEYNVHNLYGHSEAIATRKALEAVTGKRAFIIGRSTFAGSGHHEGHWLGDNFSTFESMSYSVPGILAMNIFGVPMVGADACGFIGTTTEELCNRWSALAAFTAFGRNHNTLGAPSQEPYLWPSVAATSRKVLAARYSLIHYWHTLFFQAHSNGGTVTRPLWFAFPADAHTYALDRQFLLGDALLVSPVLTEGATSVSAYLPSGATWYDFWTYKQVTQTGVVSLECGWDCIPVHIRGGNVLPLQTPGMNTVQQMHNPFQLLVALDSTGSAKGSLYLDDGETLDVGGAASTYVTFSVSAGSLSSTVVRAGFSAPGPLKTITVLGLASAPSRVLVNGQQTSSFAFSNGVLTINSLELVFTNAIRVQWS